jgi:anti-anti-sigma regulatory factor
LRTSEIRVVVQEVGGALLVPVPDPVHDRLFDEMRAALLARLHQRGAMAVVLDMSGVEVLDAHDFEAIHRMSNAVMLMGASVLLAGLRPGVAAGLVALDVDDGWVRTALSVEHALAAIDAGS